MGGGIAVGKERRKYLSTQKRTIEKMLAIEKQKKKVEEAARRSTQSEDSGQ